MTDRGNHDGLIHQNQTRRGCKGGLRTSPALLVASIFGSQMPDVSKIYFQKKRKPIINSRGYNMVVNHFSKTKRKTLRALGRYP